MAKYSYEFKKKIVDAYLRGEWGYKYLSSIYGPHKKDIQKWVNNYQSFGDEGLMRSRQQKIFSLLFDGESQRSIAKITGIKAQSSVESKIHRMRRILQQHVNREDITG